MAAWTRRTEYPTRSVRYLVEGYPALRYLKTTRPGRGLDLLCQLVDIERAVSKLGPIEYMTVLLIGLMGVPEEDVAEALGVSQSTVSRRYTRGLEMLKGLLNGTDE